MSTFTVLGEIANERVRQDEKWGEQNHRNGNNVAGAKLFADRARQACEEAFEADAGSWRHILEEKVAEALAAETEVELREELIQVAAVTVAWIECMDRRRDGV